MNDLYKIQIRSKIIRYACLLLGLCVIAYTSYHLLDKEGQVEENNHQHKYSRTLKDRNFSVSAENPTFEGLSGDHKPYMIKATEVTKNLDNKYSLQKIEAECLISPDNKLHLTADQGLFDDHTKELYLKDRVQIIYGPFSFEGHDIDIEINQKTIFTTQPIIVKYNNSSVRADGCVSDDFSKKIILRGNVRAKLQ